MATARERTASPRTAKVLLFVALPLIELAGYLDQDATSEGLLDVMARWCHGRNHPAMALSVRAVKTLKTGVLVREVRR